MKCPFCGADDTQVIDSRVNDEGDSIRRRRRCAQCDKRFTTYETAELHLPQVVKQNGTREDFNRDKLRLSFSRALHKRPVPTEYIDRALDRIVQHLLAQGEPAVWKRPHIFVAVLPGGRDDDVMRSVLGRDQQLVLRNRNGERGRRGGNEQCGEYRVTHG